MSCEFEHDLYIHHQDGKTLIIVLYVDDDLLLIGHSTSMINDMKQEVKDSFEIIDLGLLYSFWGLHISQTYNRTSLSQP